MIATLALSALAEPPRAEVLAGWSGNAVQSYGFATVQPALLRSTDGSLVARTTVSHLHYSFFDGARIHRVDSPGLSVGPAFVYTPGDLALGVGVGLGARRSTSWAVGSAAESRVKLDASLTGDVFWRPGQRAQIYTLFSLGAADRYVWARAGATYPVIPREGAVSLWLGLEGTTSGPLSALLNEVGPVAEVPVRPLGAVLGVRAALPVEDLAGGTFVLDHATFGIGAYWSY